MQDQHECIVMDRKYRIKKSTDLTQFDSIEHQEAGTLQEHKYTGQQLRCNLTLVDKQSKKIVLQRIRPSSYGSKLKAEASSLEGKSLYDQYLSKKLPTWTISKVTAAGKKSMKLNKRKVIEHHLGIWHSRGKSSLDFTKETTNHRYKQEALDLLHWANKHTDLVMNTARSSIHPSFRKNIQSRHKGRSWLETLFGKRSIDLLHPWWTTIAFFSNFAGGIHVDEDDCIPSFLFNFGEAAWIELPEFSAKVLIKPLDLVILNSQTFYHRTSPFDLPQSLAAGIRWAFSGFFREGIFNKEPVSRIAKWRLDAIFGEEP